MSKRVRSTEISVQNQGKKVKRDRFEILMQLVEQGDLDEVKAMLAEVNLATKVNERGETPLHIAVRKGNFDMAKCLLDICPSIRNVQTKANRTALHIAVGNNCEAIVKLLLDRDARLDQIDLLGRTPLFFAAAEGKSNVFNLLLEKGADVNVTDKFGNSLADLADELLEPNLASTPSKEVEAHSVSIEMDSDSSDDADESFVQMPNLIASPPRSASANGSKNHSLVPTWMALQAEKIRIEAEKLRLDKEVRRMQEESIRNQAQIELLLSILRQQQPSDF